MKEKHAMMATNSQYIATGIASGSALHPGVGSGSGSTSRSGSCEGKLIGPNIIRYPSLGRLEQDNGKVATDSDGNVIMMGDYALVDVNNSKQLFKREVIGNIDMWIKEDLAMLYKLIQDKKNKCISNPELKLEDANKCLFDPEQFKCEPIDPLDMSKQNLDIEKKLNELQKEIEYIKKIPILIASLNKDIIKDRLVLVNKLNSMKSYWKFKAEEEKRYEEYIKTLRTFKPCIHFQVTDHFHNIKVDQDSYKFAQSIFIKFQNVEAEFNHDYNIFSREKGQAISEKNYTYCNICNQELLCNHFRLGVSYLENGDPIDYDKIINIYGTERDGSYYCKQCGESIGTTDILDADDFGKGEDGFRIKTREITENTPYIEKQKQYIDKMIDNLFDTEQTVQTDELLRRINIFKLLKRLSDIELLSIKDEIDMINFLKSYTFESKTRFLEALVGKIGAGNIHLLKKKVDQLYMNYLIADIGARFLITLQTSTVDYVVFNKECSKDYSKESSNNIIGYPIINDMDAVNGINFMMCLFSQMSILTEYGSLVDLQQKLFVERLKKQADDSFIKDKIMMALNKKVDSINNMDEFANYYTNNWKLFNPRLETSTIRWTPEKILNTANLKEVTFKTMGRMLEVGRENSVYYTLALMEAINKVIETSDRSSYKILANYCCAESHGSSGGSGGNSNGDKRVKYNYMQFFKNKDSDVTKNINLFKEVEEIIYKLQRMKTWSILNIKYNPLDKPSQKIFPINFNVTPEEIKKIYLKFIDRGLNKGKLHIYDKYGRCILTNETQKEISMKTYSNQDYKRIEHAITSGNQISGKYFEIVEYDTQLIEIKKLDELIEKCPKLKIMRYLCDYLVSIKESADEIFGKGIGNVNGTSPSTKNKGGEKFNIHRHLSNLDSKIEFEIRGLVNRITTTDKNIDKYIKIMSNNGEYKELYAEYKETHTDVESNLYRYTKKEDHIQYTTKYLNDVINQIKNNRLSNPLNKDKIRPQFQDFIGFGNNIKLFKTLAISTREIYNFSQLIKSKHKYKILFPEMAASIVQYLNIISLVNLFNVLDINKIEKTETETIDYKFRVNRNPDDTLLDMNKDMNLQLENEEGILDTGEDNINFIESFEITNSDNLKLIGIFITKYLDRIADIQNTYDRLTESNINKVVTKHNQKHIEETLRGFKWLAKDGNESERQIIFLRMYNLKNISYGGIADHLKHEYGSNFMDDVANNDNDDYDGEKLREENDNELGTNHDDDPDEVGEVYDGEEDDEEDQGYDNQEVGYDDD